MRRAIKRISASHAIATLLLGALLCVCSVASATTVLKLTLADLVRGSEQIVAGQVSAVEGRMEGGRIYTYVTLKAQAHYKGTPRDEVTFRQLGGRVDDLVTVVAGSPGFVVGERVVVFLERPAPQAPLVVTGMSQGKFSVISGADAVPYVRPQLEHARLVERAQLPEGDNLSARLRDAQPSQDHQVTLPLDDFAARVRQLVTSTQESP